MRDAVGGSLLLNMVVFFLSIVILFFVGMLSYTKAFRIKNRIIEIIEKHENYDKNVALELSSDLQQAGYRIATKEQIISKCGEESLTVQADANHLYCVYKDNLSLEGYSYKVVTYIHFNFPLIGELLEIPIKGETKVLGKNYNY